MKSAQQLSDSGAFPAEYFQLNGELIILPGKLMTATGTKLCLEQKKDGSLPETFLTKKK